MSAPAPRIAYDPDLVEAVVESVLRARMAEGDREAFDRFRRAADRIYTQQDQPQGRRQVFAALYLRVFEELGCGKPLVESMRTFAGRIREVLVMRAWTVAEEGVEYSPDGRLLGLRLLPVRFASSAALESFLLHEFGHVEDMLDETFGYGRGLADAAGRIPQLQGRRFGFLWDCSVDGRLRRRGMAPGRTPEELEDEGRRLFPGLPPAAVAAVVHKLGEEERPTYGDLVLWAGNPAALAAWAGVARPVRGEEATRLPGDLCPLCSFPTYVWTGTIPAAIAMLVQDDFPTWQPGAGACARCIEAYSVPAAGTLILRPVGGEV